MSEFEPEGGLVVIGGKLVTETSEGEPTAGESGGIAAPPAPPSGDSGDTAPDAGITPPAFGPVSPPPPAQGEPEQAAATPIRAANKGSLEKRLTDAFGRVRKTKDGYTYLTGLAGVAYAFNTTDGQIIAANSEAMGAAWAHWARESPRIRRYLEWALTGSAAGDVAMAMLPVVIGIAMNHGLGGDILGLGAKPAEPEPEPNTGAATGPRTDWGTDSRMGSVSPGL